MTGRPYRLAAAVTAGLIDRTRTIAFSFDGKTMTGYAGDTLASALMANGQRAVRPQLQISPAARRCRPRRGGDERARRRRRSGAAHEPNLRATQVELHDGLVAVSQNRWPSLAFDVGAVNDSFSRLIPGGFYYKTFMWPPAFWKHVYEPLIRRAAGLGTRPTAAIPIPTSISTLIATCWSSAAGSAASPPRKPPPPPAPGSSSPTKIRASAGLADIDGGADRRRQPAEWVRPRGARSGGAERHVLPRTTASATWHHNSLMLSNGWPITIRHCRRRSAAPALVEGARQAGDPGDRRHRAADRLRQQRPSRHHAGLAVRAYVRALWRGAGQSRRDLHQQRRCLPHRARAQIGGRRRRPVVDLPRHGRRRARRTGPRGAASDVAGSAIAGVESSRRPGDHRGQVASYRPGPGASSTRRKFACDFVAMSGGYNPALHLWCHNGGKLRFDEALQSFRPDTPSPTRSARSAPPTAPSSLAGVLPKATAAGEAAAKRDCRIDGQADAQAAEQDRPRAAARADLVLARDRQIQRRQQALHRFPERRDRRRSRTRPARGL